MKLIRYLARSMKLMYGTYVYPDRPYRGWLTSHFSNIDFFLTERARWVIAPIETTLDDLRKDFYSLTETVIVGQYGTIRGFEPHGPLDKGPDALLSTSRTKRWMPFTRFIGFVLPLVLFGLYLWRPAVIPFITVNPNVLALFLVAWFLLAIDSLFQLGVVSGLTKLAKDIKEMS